MGFSKRTFEELYERYTLSSIDWEEEKAYLLYMQMLEEEAYMEYINKRLENENAKTTDTNKGIDANNTDNEDLPF
jgi:hypothetical protein